MVYHMVRGQSVIKLYVIYNMLEVRELSIKQISMYNIVVCVMSVLMYIKVCILIPELCVKEGIITVEPPKVDPLCMHITLMQLKCITMCI